MEYNIHFGPFAGGLDRGRQLVLEAYVRGVDNSMEMDTVDCWSDDPLDLKIRYLSFVGQTACFNPTCLCMARSAQGNKFQNTIANRMPIHVPEISELAHVFVVCI